MKKRWFLVIGILTVLLLLLTTVSATESNTIISISWGANDLLAVSGGQEKCDNDVTKFAIKIIDPNTYQTVTVLAKHKCKVNSVDWNKDGTFLVSVSSNEDKAYIWDINLGKAISETPSQIHGIISAKWNPNGQNIASPFISNAVSIWDPTLGTNIGPANLRGITLDWNFDGTEILSGSGYDDLIMITNLSDDSLSRSFNTGFITLVTLDWTLDNTKIAALHADNTMKIWDADTGILLNSFNVENPTSLQWSPNSQNIAVGTSDGGVLIYDGVMENLVTKYTTDGSVNAVAWSPDGTQLAFGGAGNNGEIEIVEPFASQESPISITPSPTP